jgi:DEAD/DEAH box helicase domain-containing protein
VGGLSTPLHPHTGSATIFVYDGYPGGVALARAAYEDVERLMATTLEMLRGCPCEAGCPACVQSPHCGNANDPLDKGLAIELLRRLVDR